MANAELAHQISTQGGEAASAFAVSDAVLHQRTYFVPTMVRGVNMLRLGYTLCAPAICLTRDMLENHVPRCMSKEDGQPKLDCVDWDNQFSLGNSSS